MPFKAWLVASTFLTSSRRHRLLQLLQKAWELFFEYPDQFAQQIVIVIHACEEVRQIHANLRSDRLVLSSPLTGVSRRAASDRAFEDCADHVMRRRLLADSVSLMTRQPKRFGCVRGVSRSAKYFSRTCVEFLRPDWLG